MKKRERIDQKISRIEKDIDFYNRLNDEGGDFDDRLQSLAEKKDRLLADADHYDREQSAGYLKPCTHRWRK